MTRSIWQLDANGVIHFKPAEPSEPAKTADTAKPEESANQELDSLTDGEDDFVHVSTDNSLSNSFPLSSTEQFDLPFHVKSEPPDSSGFRFSISPGIVSVGSNGDVVLNSQSFLSPAAPRSKPQPYIFDQLKEFAKPTENDFPTSRSSQTIISTSSSYSTEISDIEKSPCPRKTGKKVARSTGKTRHYFKPSKVEKQEATKITRPPWFQTGANRDKATTLTLDGKTENALSLAYLEDVERKPKNEWTDDQRIVLLCLYRWYRLPSRDLTMLFNSVTGLTMRHGALNVQFAHGGSPMDKIRRPLYSIPFNDPAKIYQNVRNIIEARAEELGIEIRRREEPAIHKYEDVGRQESFWVVQESPSPSSKASGTPSNTPRSKILGGFAIAVDEVDDVLDTFADVDELPSSSPRESEISFKMSSASCLAFRVWDNKSWTRFTNDGFVCEASTYWNGSLPPFKPDGETKVPFMLQAAQHLSKKGMGSVFVSLSTSLLQAFVIAAREGMQDPQVAVIDLEHATLREPYKKHHARALLSYLKKDNQAQWARYKGHAEYLIWHTVPKAAILHTFSLSELNRLAEVDPDVANVLQLEIFKPNLKARQIAPLLRKSQTTMNSRTARAMGVLAKQFGLGGPRVNLSHIEEFVSYLVDGWYIEHVPINDIHTMGTLASQFTDAMDVRRSPFLRQQIMAAFTDGVTRGLSNIKYYTSRRTRFKRRKPA